MNNEVRTDHLLAVQALDAASAQEARRLAAHLGVPFLEKEEVRAAETVGKPEKYTANAATAGRAAEYGADAGTIGKTGEFETDEENAGTAGIHETNSGFELFLNLSREGLSLEGDGLSMKADYLRMKKRVQPGKWEHELLVKAVRIRDHTGSLHVMDCTAGMGEDALILAAAGFEVSMYEKNPVIAALLQSELKQAGKDPLLAQVTVRMTFQEDDSLAALARIAEGKAPAPEVIYLDPMFQKRTKSGLIKKKFQLLHRIEQPCADEEELLNAALTAHPKKIVIKRPAKGPYLAGMTPGYSIRGKAIRFDCIVPR